MPETTATTETTTAETTTQTVAPPAAATVTTTDTTTETTLDAVALARELAQARKDAGKYRDELKKLQDTQKTAEDAKLTEDEKRVARIAELEKTVTEREQALRDRTAYAAVVDAAARLGAAKPTMIHKLIEGDIEFEDDGTPKNVEDLVKAFLRSNPEFASTAGRPTGDVGQGARSPGSKLTKEMLKNMKPEQVNRLDWNEVQEVLRSN